VVVCVASTARGDEAEAEARRHFEAGSREYSLGEFRKAAEEYKQAFRAKPDPVLLYNVAQAYRLANDPAQAIFFYQSYLRSVPDAHNRHEVDERIKKLQAQLKQNVSPPNSTLRPDGQPVPATEINPPSAPQEAAAPPEPAAAAVATPLSPTTPAAPPSSEASAPTVAAPAAVLTDAPPKKPVYKKWWLWTAVGLGVAAVGVGLGVGLGLGLSHAPTSHFGTTQIF
jgi:tetratricopeptide (TPR) repeat protein